MACKSCEERRKALMEAARRAKSWVVRAPKKDADA